MHKHTIKIKIPVNHIDKSELKSKASLVQLDKQFKERELHGELDPLSLFIAETTFASAIVEKSIPKVTKTHEDMSFGYLCWSGGAGQPAHGDTESHSDFWNSVPKVG